MKIYYVKKKLKDGTTIDLHRFIMQEHIGRKLSFNEIVHHIDGNKLNNELSNLEICSRSNHSKEHFNIGGLYKLKREDIIKGVEKRTTNNRLSSKITKDMFINIFELFNKGLSCRNISRIIGLHHTNVAKIIRGAHWSNKIYS